MIHTEIAVRVFDLDDFEILYPFGIVVNDYKKLLVAVLSITVPVLLTNIDLLGEKTLKMLELLKDVLNLHILVGVLLYTLVLTRFKAA